MTCYELIITLFSTAWKMAGMKTLIIIFVIMYPVAMITQDDVDHGGPGGGGGTAIYGLYRYVLL